jgi:hypothetical protein
MGGRVVVVAAGVCVVCVVGLSLCVVYGRLREDGGCMAASLREDENEKKAGG